MLTIDEDIFKDGQAFLIANYTAEHANSRLDNTSQTVGAAHLPAQQQTTVGPIYWLP